MSNQNGALVDNLGRKIDYLRVSITDRCNLRCFYCMPPDGVKKMEHDDILSYENIKKIAKVAADMGLKKVRFTGGEPLVRKDFSELVQDISSLPGIEDLSLTTNGILLPDQAVALQQAGLNRVNISLDTLDRHKFYNITGVDSFEKVMEGIDKANFAGLYPVKLNVVVIKGTNYDEIADFAKLTLTKPLEIRFIEYMPIGESDQWEQEFISSEEIKKVCSDLGELFPVNSDRGSGPANYFKYNDSPGKLGFISAISNHFCSNCNRLRLTSDGKLKSCLFSNNELDLMEALHSEEAIRHVLLKSLATKPLSHNITGQKTKKNSYLRGMSQIGG